MALQREQTTLVAISRNKRAKELGDAEVRVAATSRSEGERNNAIEAIMRPDDAAPMNLISSATAVKRRLDAANQGRTIARSEQVATTDSSGSRSSTSDATNGASDRRVLLISRNEVGGSPTNQSTGGHTSPEVPVHKPHICRYHKQQQQQHLKRAPGTCAGQQLAMAPRLVKNNNNNNNHHHHNHHDHHHLQRHSNQVHHQPHCVHHHGHQQHHACARINEEPKHNYPKQQSCPRANEPPFVMIKREHNSRPSLDENEKSRKQRRNRAATSTRELNEAVQVHHHHHNHKKEEQQMMMVTSKRTTMRFISQLYFLIHLSAILSLLLHHKNLVTSEIWQLHAGQRRQTTIAQEDHDPMLVHHLTKQHTNTDQNETSQMPALVLNQLPIPLMLSPSAAAALHPLGTISSFVPALAHQGRTSSASGQQLRIGEPAMGNASRVRRTLSQVLVTPAKMGPLGGGDILVRLFGYRHARWALHYFLAYLLGSSITMLVCLRMFRNRTRPDRCTCCHPPVTGWPPQSNKEPEGVLVSGQQTAITKASPTRTTFGGFYHRTRLDCTPVLVGSISLGLIQLIVIGLDVATKVDWLQSPSDGDGTETSSRDQNEPSRWPIYLPFLHFAFVSLLMQFILGKVAKNNEQATTSCRELRQTTAGHLANSRMPINGHTTATSLAARSKGQPLLLLVPQYQVGLNGLLANRHQKHQHQTENNGSGRVGGWQNIALAHLLVTHILLWLMKLNSISLFQAIEQNDSLAQSYSKTRSRSSSAMSPDELQAHIEHPKLHVPANIGVLDEKANRSRQSNDPTRQTGTETDRMGREINRPEREFNRTELEKILRPAPKSNPIAIQQPPPPAQLEANSSGQVSKRQFVGESQPTSPGPAMQQQQKSERGLRSAAQPEGAGHTYDSSSTTSNNSIRMSHAQLANLIDLATKNAVQRSQVAQPTPRPHTTTTTTTSSTTSRPQYRSSLPKRMTVFRQIQRPVSLWPANKTLAPPPPLPQTTTTTTTTDMPTTRSSGVQVPFADLSKVINLAPLPGRAKIQVSRENDMDAGGENSIMDTPIGDDFDTRRRQTGLASTERPFPSVESDPPAPPGGHLMGSNARQPLEATTIDYGGNETTDERDIKSETEPPRAGDNGDAEDADSDLDSLLPPVPNYNNETSNEPEESEISLSLLSPLGERQSAISVGSEQTLAPAKEALVMWRNQEPTNRSGDWPSAADQPDQQQQQLSFSDYLLPIVYQYHILIIAILFNLWLDSLRTPDTPSRATPPVVLPASDRPLAGDQSGRSSSVSDGGSSSPSARGRPQRSRSAESDTVARANDRRRLIGGRHLHREHSQRGWRETISIGGSYLSRYNSLRTSSSERLLRLADGRQSRQPKQPRRRQIDWDSGSFSSSSSSSPARRQRPPVRLIMPAAQMAAPRSSACSVFLGLLVVSAALVVILLGMELLTILNQCATQLLSILASLVGLCLGWRSHLRDRRAHQKCCSRLSGSPGGRRLLLSSKGATYLTNPNDIVLSGPTIQLAGGGHPGQSSPFNQGASTGVGGGNNRQFFHHLFLLAAYFSGVSIALNLGKQLNVQQLFPAHIMQFLQRHWLQATVATSSHRNASSHIGQGDPSSGLLHNFGLFWSANLPQLATASSSMELPLSPMILFHVVLASKGLLLIVQVTLQTILIRSGCNQRTSNQLRQVYTFLMFSNLSLWAMDLSEQQQHLQRQEIGTLPLAAERVLFDVDRLRLVTLEGFTQFACSIVTLSHLYHGLVFMQH